MVRVVKYIHVFRMGVHSCIAHGPLFLPGVCDEGESCGGLRRQTMDAYFIVWLDIQLYLFASKRPDP